MVGEKNDLLTQAKRASEIDPKVQNREKTMDQKPLFLRGTNSRKREKSTGAPPRPTPTRNLKKKRAGREGDKELRSAETEVRMAGIVKPILRRREAGELRAELR